MKQEQTRLSGQVVLRGGYNGRSCIFVNGEGPRVIGLVWYMLKP